MKPSDRHPNKFRKECVALEKELEKLFDCDDKHEVCVYASADPGDGFRIHEVDHHLKDGTAGCSWMRSTCDVWSTSLILTCEDFVRSFNDKPFRPAGWSSDIDDHADAVFKLEQVWKALKETPA